MTRTTWKVMVLVLFWQLAMIRMAVADIPPALAAVGLDEHLGASVPLDLPFVDENGHAVTIGKYFGSQPVLLVLAWYQCPGLCSEVQNGVVQCLMDLPLEVGKDLQVVTVSIDPNETSDLALARKKTTVLRYGKGGSGFHYLTGQASSISALARAVGFRYKYDARTRQYAHPSGIMVASPQGRLVRYLYGVRYSSRDLRLALQEASHNQIGTPAEKIALLCFDYDPTTGRYGVAILRLLKISGAMLCVGLGSFVWRHRHG